MPIYSENTRVFVRTQYIKIFPFSLFTWKTWKLLTTIETNEMTKICPSIPHVSNFKMFLNFFSLIYYYCKMTDHPRFLDWFNLYIKFFRTYDNYFLTQASAIRNDNNSRLYFIVSLNDITRWSSSADDFPKPLALLAISIIRTYNT